MSECVHVHVHTCTCTCKCVYNVPPEVLSALHQFFAADKQCTVVIIIHSCAATCTVHVYIFLIRARQCFSYV